MLQLAFHCASAMQPASRDIVLIQRGWPTCSSWDQELIGEGNDIRAWVGPTVVEKIYNMAYRGQNLGNVAGDGRDIEDEIF